MMCGIHIFTMYIHSSTPPAHQGDVLVRLCHQHSLLIYILMYLQACLGQGAKDNEVNIVSLTTIDGEDEEITLPIAWLSTKIPQVLTHLHCLHTFALPTHPHCPHFHSTHASTLPTPPCLHFTHASTLPMPPLYSHPHASTLPTPPLYPHPHASTLLTPPHFHFTHTPTPPLYQHIHSPHNPNLL